MRNPVRALVLTFACAPLLASCEPCGTLTGCSDRPNFTVVGRLLREESAEPVVNARIDFVRTGGVGLVVDSARDLTDENGVFSIHIDGLSAGLVNGEMVVRSPAGDAASFEYRVLDQVYRVFFDEAEANVLPIWSTRPSFPDIAQVVGAAPGAVGGLQVEFRRTGGVALVQGDVFRTVTRSDGVFELFDRRVTPVDVGDVIGDLYIDINGFVLRDLRITATAEFRRNAGLRFVDVSAAPMESASRER